MFFVHLLLLLFWKNLLHFLKMNANHRARSWIVTCNNPPNEERDWQRYFDNLLEQNEDLRFACGQLERGESGTLHLQAFVCMKKQVRFRRVQELLDLGSVHLEVARGNVLQCVNYVTKEETREVGPFYCGALFLRYSTGYVGIDVDELCEVTGDELRCDEDMYIEECPEPVVCVPSDDESEPSMMFGSGSPYMDVTEARSQYLCDLFDE